MSLLRERLRPKVALVVGLILLALVPVHAAGQPMSPCRMQVDFYNKLRRLAGTVNAECNPLSPLGHSAPFGNWGVRSNYGEWQDAFQFSGWKLEDDSRQWNSCTTRLSKFRPPSRCGVYYNDGFWLDNRCYRQKAVPDDVNRYAMVIVPAPASAPTASCPEVLVFSGLYMKVSELDEFPPFRTRASDSEHVTTLRFPTAKVPVTCRTGRCSGESLWHAQMDEDKTGVTAQMNVRVSYQPAPTAGVAQHDQPVRGTVLSRSSQQPVVNAAVTYESSDTARLATATNSAGTFVFSGEQLGETGVVTVSHRAFATTHRRWPPADGDALLIEMEPPVVLSGTLAGDSQTRRPLAGSVTVLVHQQFQAVSRTVETKDDGRFVIEDVPAGSGIIFGASVGHAPTVQQFTVSAGRRIERDVLLPRAVALRGLVLDGDNPVKGAQVAAEYTEMADAEFLTGFIGGRLTTDSDGTFVLSGLRPHAAIAIQASHNGRATDVRTVRVNSGTVEERIVLSLTAR